MSDGRDCDLLAEVPLPAGFTTAGPWQIDGDGRPYRIIRDAESGRQAVQQLDGRCSSSDSDHTEMRTAPVDPGASTPGGSRREQPTSERTVR